MKTTIALALTGALFAATTAVFAESDHGGWQWQRLMHPQQHQLQREANGAVYIYTGLHERQVETAMEQEFERVDNMMFVGVRVETPEGETVQDDGCD